MNNKDYSTSNQLIGNLHLIADSLQSLESKHQSKINRLLNKEALWLKNMEIVPKWAEEYISTTRKLDALVRSILDNFQGEVSGKTLREIKSPEQLQAIIDQTFSEYKQQIPPHVLEILMRNREKANALAEKLGLLPDERTSFVDPDRLLTSPVDRPIKNPNKEWHLNLGLLLHVYDRTQDESLKKKISFLVLNYLAKAAPINIEDLGLDPATTKQLVEMFQFGLFQMTATYHREFATFEYLLNEQISQLIPKKASESPTMLLTDTSHLTTLYPTRFSVLTVNPKASEEQLEKDWEADLAARLMDHFQGDNSAEDFYQFLEPPILLDLTELLGELPIGANQEKEKEFNTKLARYEDIADRAVSGAVQRIKSAHPELFTSPSFENKLEIFIRQNIVSITTFEIKGVGVIKTLPLFNNPDIFQRYMHESDDKSSVWRFINDKEAYARSKLDEFVNLSGSRLGAVRGREIIFNFLDLQTVMEKAPDAIRGHGQIVTYEPSGSNVLYFPNRASILETSLFKRLESRFNSTEIETKAPPQAQILGESTLKILKGLLTEITDEKWIELHANPETRELVQTSLFRIMQHLAQAGHQMNDFKKYTQAIELVHCEIASLLYLTSPFTEGDFPGIYKNQLSFIPPSMADWVQIGTAKSAMNIFAGINAAIKRDHPDLNRAYDANSYYEEIGLIGSNHTTQEVLRDPSIDRVDLYVGEFNHNINVNPSFSHYQPGAIIEEVEALLAGKPETKHLTVAIDCTIEYIHSDKTKAILEHFAEEIKEGKLNFVFFRSGQKFDMLGMDNYYGANFFTVNNGGEQWKEFNDLFKNEAFQIDPLSLQWFCLVNKYAPQATDAYRKQIFANTRKILDQVPAILQPGANPHVRVNTVDPGMDACFIDIKVSPPLDTREVELLIHQIFAKHRTKIHTRGSFGFYHPNVNIIGDTLRINPGLNPQEVAIFVEFLEALASRIPAIQTRQPT